jgi:hypothetical protein
MASHILSFPLTPNCWPRQSHLPRQANGQPLPLSGGGLKGRHTPCGLLLTPNGGMQGGASNNNAAPTIVSSVLR